MILSNRYNVSGPSDLFVVLTKDTQKPYRSDTNIVLDVSNEYNYVI